MGGGSKGEGGIKEGFGDGEEGGCVNYRPCRTHRHIREFGCFVSRDNKHSAPECGFEWLKLTLLVCV